MNYRLLLSEMFIDYVERLQLEKNVDKRKVYKEVIRDLKLSLDIEPTQIEIVQNVNKLINHE
jgi:hypothetical protein